MDDQGKRILGIDFGEKRVGVALSDESLTLASGILTLENHRDHELAKEIKKICDENNVSKIILGLPKNLKGQETASAKKVRQFAEILKKEILQPIEFEDERLTSVMVRKRLHEKGLKEVQIKKEIDKKAAEAILQGYLDKIKNLK